MKRGFLFLMLCVLFSLLSCDKYKSLSGNSVLSGHAYIEDTVANTLPAPLQNGTLYLSAGSDTSSYLYVAKTDSSGFFSIPFLSGSQSVTLYSRFVRGSVGYSGAVTFHTSSQSTSKNLIIYPSYTNGMKLFFTDIYGGAVSRIPFRIYQSFVLATIDSTKYAFADTASDLNGQFHQFNLQAAKYYIVSRDSIAGSLYTAMDSIPVATSGIAERQVVVHEH